MLEQYPNDVKVVYKNFPLPGHSKAKDAALAALAAGKQGKFWEMHDRLFENMNRLNDMLYNSIAKDLGLDMARFSNDRFDETLEKMIDRDIKEGSEIGVTGTPSIFVNGRRLKTRSLDGFKELIEPEIKRAKR